MRSLLRDRSGNALAIVAAAIVPLLAIIGGGIDMGRSYLSESRLQQACDAGTLAARKKLGSTVVLDGMVPAAVADSGNKFFDINFRDGSYGTENRAFTMTLENDYSISGVATVDVPTTVMRLFAFNKVGLQVTCEARLNFSNTDVMMVLDTTGSMTQTNPGDTKPKIEVLKDVVANFHTMLEGSKGPGTRIRYGFVPYAANVNVGGLLADDWVTNNWTYQSREDIPGPPVIWDNTYWDNWVTISGSYDDLTGSTYPATYHPGTSGGESGGGVAPYYTCDTGAPANTYNSSSVVLSDVTEPYVGPPAGTKRTRHIRLTENGKYYWVELSGTTCLVRYYDFHTLVREYDEITIPVSSPTTNYEYKPVSFDVSNWRSITQGCIEERATYEITDYNNVDFSRALDLDLDRVPTAGNPDTQWHPHYPDVIWERSLDWYGNGSFSVAPVPTNDGYFFHPVEYFNYLLTCPTPARKLAEMNASEVGNYLATLTTGSLTYHDIGMIWGGRLISKTGLFAAENADVPGKPTNRHLIFLTDGRTETADVVYGAYGVEPLDQRRLPANKMNQLTQTVENRFTVACNEVKKRNITVWVIGFGVTMNNLMKDCAGSGRWFQADNATQLNAAFAKIAASMGDLRISK